MATKVIMPALGMAQETGKLIAWLKHEGDAVTKGEPIMEIETDKAVVEYEAAASGILGGIRAGHGQDVPVGEMIAWILEPGEDVPDVEPVQPAGEEIVEVQPARPPAPMIGTDYRTPQISQGYVEISPVARNIAREHRIDLGLVKPDGNRIQKADVLAYIDRANGQGLGAGVVLASPKARRLAGEHGLALETITGSGPEGAVLAADVLSQAGLSPPTGQISFGGQPMGMSKAWASMASRLIEAWQTIPHFYLEREVNASRMVAWRKAAQKKSESKITFTDLLIKAVARALIQHPRVNAAWMDGSIHSNDGVHVGLAVATEDGLVVPVIPNTDRLSVAEIAVQRETMVARALEGKLKIQDLQGGTFTISNLGMYGIDRFSAIVNPPQAAILAVGKIADKAIPENGKIKINPMMRLTLSCDHRVVDGARGAKFLDTLTDYLEEPQSI